MAAIPIRAIGAATIDESDDLLTAPISAAVTIPTHQTGDRLLLVTAFTYTARPNTRVPVITVSGWSILEAAQDANIGGLARSGTYLGVHQLVATGSDTCTVELDPPSGTTEMDAVVVAFVIACRGNIPQIDFAGQSGLANNVDPTSTYTIDSHPTDEGGSLMFAAAANTNPLNLFVGGENGLTKIHAATGDGAVLSGTWPTISVAEGSTTPTTADAGQWDLSSGGVQWATVFVTYGPYNGGGVGIFVDGAVH